LKLDVEVEWTFGYSGNRKQASQEKLWRLRRNGKGWQRLSGEKKWCGLGENRVREALQWEKWLWRGWQKMRWLCVSFKAEYCG